MDEPATVRCGDRSLPLAEVKARASRLANALRGLGVGHGDRYAIVLRNEIAFLEATLAGGVIGAVPVPVNWHWTGDDLRHLLHDSGASVVIAHTDLLPAVERHAAGGMTIVEAAVPPEVAAAYGLGDVPITGRHVVLEELIDGHEPVAQPNTEPPLGVIYTSGTTGLAKGILRQPVTAETLPLLAKLVGSLLFLKPGWRTMEPAPMYHTAPNVHATFAAAFGMDIRIMPRFEPEEFLRLVQDEHIDTVQLVPTMFTRLLALPADVRSRYDLSSLKAVVHAAAPCPVEVKRTMIDWWGPIINEYYSSTEGAGITWITSTEWLQRPGSVGRAMAGEAFILDDEHRVLPTGEIGTVWFGGAPEFTYHNDPDKTAEARDADGRASVGDVGYLDEDGYLFLTDRKAFMIISGGVNIYPQESENVLINHPKVVDVGVIGVPDAEMGEAVKAVVQPVDWAAAGAELEAELLAYCREHLASFKCPRSIDFDRELPRLDTGKLYKKALRARYWP
jgi:long-chain acyl-CoA synthetase